MTLIMDDRGFKEIKGKIILKEFVKFSEYLNRLVNEPSRGDELKELIKLFGIAKLDSVLESSKEKEVMGNYEW